MDHRTISALLLMLCLSACAELDSIHRRTRLPYAANGELGGEVVTVDAKQRHLLVMPELKQGAETRWRVCAEASPDVFSAFAASGGLRGDKSGGEASFASAETVASIERTQTINLLRESFYRTCERYTSGAISRSQFVVQAARDQKSMVATLAIEQLTGAVRPKSTIITPNATSAAVMSGEGAAQLLRDYNDRVKEAMAKRDTAKTAVDDAAKKGGACSSDDRKDHEVECLALDTTLTTRESELKSAQDGLDNAVKLAKDLVSATSATTGAGQNQQGGGVSYMDANAAAVMGVATAVTDIVNLSFIDEPLMFCVGYLGDPETSAPGKDVTITSTCLQILLKEQEANQALKRALPALRVDDLAAFTNGIADAAPYKKFKTDLLETVQGLSDKNFSAWLTKFDEATGGTFSIAPNCPDKAKCLAFIVSSDPFKSEFRTNGAALTTALAASKK